jgi:hypothetical protein
MPIILQNNLPCDPPVPARRARPSLGVSGRGYRVAILYFALDTLIAFLRGVERLGGPGLLSFAAKPCALIDVIQRSSDFFQFARLRRALGQSFWKGIGPVRHYLAMAFTGYDVLCALLNYDRWGAPAWKNRFQVIGTPPHLLPQWGRRPYILAFQHTGAFGVIYYWMRAQGVPCVAYAGGVPMVLECARQLETMRKGDGLFGVADVPLIFLRKRGLREAINFLKPGRVLAMAIDGARLSPEMDAFDAGGRRILAKCGAARLAAQTKAIVIPVAARRIGRCRFELRFGTPVPDEAVRADDYREATQHLITDLWPQVEAHPADLNWTTLEALAPELRAPRTSWP